MYCNDVVLWGFEHTVIVTNKDINLFKHIYKFIGICIDDSRKNFPIYNVSTGKT